MLYASASTSRLTFRMPDGSLRLRHQAKLLRGGGQGGTAVWGVRGPGPGSGGAATGGAGIMGPGAPPQFGPQQLPRSGPSQQLSQQCRSTTGSSRSNSLPWLRSRCTHERRPFAARIAAAIAAGTRIHAPAGQGQTGQQDRQGQALTDHDRFLRILDCFLHQPRARARGSCYPSLCARGW